MIEFREAIRLALDEALSEDPSVFLIGEDIAQAGGVFAVTTGLLERHGPTRVIDTPISELAMTGAAYGAALTGKRPVLEIMFGDFLALSMDSIINQAAKFHFLDGERGVPLVIRCTVGGGARFGAIHSQMPIAWMTGIPGIKLITPSNPTDAYRMTKAAIHDENPVIVFEHKRLYSTKGPIDGPDLPIGRATVARVGSDITIVSSMIGVHEALAAASTLEEEGIDAEVIDLRTIRPLDRTTVLTSLAKTNRLLVVEEGSLTGGWAGEVLALAIEHGLEDIDLAWRITTPDGAVPYSPPLEDAWFPNAERIASDVRARLAS